MTPFKHILLLLLIVSSELLTSNAMSQEDNWQPTYENFTTAEDFPSMECYYSCQDDNGYMWFGTDRGVVRYNGKEFKTFTKEDGLESNVVYKIVPDDKGRIWFLSNSLQLCYYQNGEIKPYKYNDRLLSDGKILQVMSYTSWSFKNDEIILSTALNDPLKIDKNGKVSHPIQSDGKSVQFYETEGILINTKIAARFTILTTKKFRRLDTVYFTAQRPKAGWIKKDVPYLTTGGKITIYEKNKNIEYEFDKYILCVTVIGEDIWIGLGERGLRKFKIINGRLVEQARYFNGISVLNVFLNDQNHIWIASQSNGVFRLKDWSVSKLIDPQNYWTIARQKNILYFTTPSPNGKLICYDVLKNTFDKETFKNVSLFRGLLFSEQLGELFVSTRELGNIPVKTYKIEGKEKVLTDYPWLTDHFWLDSNRAVSIRSWVALNDKYLFKVGGVAFSLEKINDHELWCIHDRRLKRIDLDAKTIRDVDEKLLKQRINWVKRIDGIVYFGTNGSGLVIEKDGQLIEIGKEEGLIQTHINKIVKGENGVVWLMGSYNVTAFRPLPNGEFEYQLYSTQSLTCNKIHDICYSQGFAYLATDKGVIRIESKKKLKNISIPRLHIINLMVNGVEKQLKRLSLPYNQNDFVLNYDAIFFDNKDVVFRYRYRQEEPWTVVSERSLRLNSLSSGTYEFEIQAGIEGGEWSKSEYVYFEILPPFWKRWWFILIEVLLGIGLVVFLVILRLRFVDRRYSEAQKNMQLRQEALSQQMNPHFIFNALGSVQNSILKGDSLKANNYLVRFSRLLRSGLNASRSQFITLEEDQELMQNYLAVEKSRLGDDFTFIVDVELTSEPYSLHIPPFLLQPFLENSIKHGFGDSQIAGHIDVRYTEEKESIKCVITDNGIGREAAKKKTISNHTSHGVEIAFERVDLFNRSQGFIGERVITDRKDADGNAQGTIVMFSLPKLKK